MLLRLAHYPVLYLLCFMTITVSMKVGNIGDRMAVNIEKMYGRSTKIRCPFWRRRAADVLDASSLMLSFFLARHKSLGSWYPPGCASLGEQKVEGLSVGEIANIIQHDWQPGNANTGKGYYITGKLSKCIYRDDCFFDGPDPGTVSYLCLPNSYKFFQYLFNIFPYALLS